MTLQVELPKPTKKRLVQIFQLLQNWRGERIKSVEIAAVLGCKNSSVRHDLFLAGFNEGVSNGYKVCELKSFLEKILSFETSDSEKKKCCIVGLGRLGAALLDDSIFLESGFCVGCGFDSNVNRVEILRSTYPLYPTFEMDRVIKSEKIEYAILCVPDKDAQNMADKLVNAGVRRLVNMTRAYLIVPGGVKVTNASPVLALQKY